MGLYHMPTAKYIVLDYHLYISLSKYVKEKKIYHISYCFTYATPDSQFSGLNIIPYISLSAERKKLADTLHKISNIHDIDENLAVVFNSNSSQQKLLAYEICLFYKKNDLKKTLPIININDLTHKPTYQRTYLHYREAYLNLEVLRRENISNEHLIEITPSINSLYSNGNIVIHHENKLISTPINIIDNYVLLSLHKNHESILSLTANVISRLLNDGYEGVGDLVIMSRIHYLSSIKAIHCNNRLAKVNAFNLFVKPIANK
ncbi:hypothetical protein C9I36_02245 [Pectobacterium punjabense]|nr:hypothetical protein C9I36_02245 [Pectobacterium punjabense]